MTSTRSKAEKPDPDDMEEKIRQLGKKRVLVVPQMLDFHLWLDVSAWLGALVEWWVNPARL